MPHYSVGYGVHREGEQRRAFLLVECTPWWVVVVGKAGELLCRVTRNRGCHLLCGQAEELAERHRRQFETPCAPEHAAAFSHWRGWGRPFFMDEVGAQIPYESPTGEKRYERLP